MLKELLDDICQELDIEYKIISNNYLIYLKKNGKTKFIWGNKFDLNNHGLGIAFDDKYATYEVLKNIDVPVIEHSILYSSKNKSRYAKNKSGISYMKEIFNKYNKDIVLKVNNGSKGFGVYHINSFSSFLLTSNKLFLSNKSLSVTPYENIINEYRVIVLNKEIKLMYGKKNPVVVGDGTSSLKDLLVKFNEPYFKNKKIKNYILKKNEVYNYDFKFNLSKGSRAFIVIDEEIKKDLIKVVNKIVNNIDCNFVSVDIVKTVDNKYKVLEINSGVSIEKVVNFIDNGYAIAKEIYKDAINSMF